MGTGQNADSQNVNRLKFHRQNIEKYEVSLVLKLVLFWDWIILF